MKKIIFILILITLSAKTTKLLAAHANGEDEWPVVEAQGAILMDFETGRVLWEKNADKPMSNASTTKILTAIVALENGNLNDEVTISLKAQNTAPVKMFLTKGEVISLEGLLHALMLQSSNDAAVAIAEHIGGTVENFCSMMTKKAKELGARDTLFETPNGLDTENHHSTAYDLAMIAIHALKNPDFVRITNTMSYTVTSSKRTYNINNKNRLLNEFEGANGIKTGYTDKAGHCFVGAAKRDGMQLVSVVLASGWGASGKEQKWKDTKKILSFGFNNYEFKDIIKENDFVQNVAISRSKQADVDTVYSNGLYLPLKKDNSETVVIENIVNENVKAPISIGDNMGVTHVYVNNVLYRDIDIISTENAIRHDMKTCIESVLNTMIQTSRKEKAEIILPEYFFGE